ncbi:TIGR02677 family protein [Cupriavidus basilensis]
MSTSSDSADLFRHVSAEKALLYRAIMSVFAAAKRQYRLQLRPDEVLAEAEWPDGTPALKTSTSRWRNSPPGAICNRSRIPLGWPASTISTARAFCTGSHSAERQSKPPSWYSPITCSAAPELQTVALEDIASRLAALQALLDGNGDTSDADVAKVHEILRDLVLVFENLADNAQAFMAGIARSIELQRAEATAVATYKRRLIDYLERFMGDLVRRSDTIARLLLALGPRINLALQQVAEREARDAAPGDERELAEERARRWRAWLERWKGLRGWFLSTGQEPPQAELLRARARAAIPQLLGAIAALNERRSGRSDRSADFRTLAGWFASCDNDDDAHRLARAAFALNPARHFSLNPLNDADLPASTPWADAPPLEINPRLREYGEAAPRGPLPKVRDRSAERALMAVQFAEESRQVDAARQHLATGRATRLSELGELDLPTFGLFLNLLGEALSEQARPDKPVERQTGDGLLRIRLEPLEADSLALITTPSGVFSRRDHRLTISPTQELE